MKHIGQIVEVDTLNHLFTIRPDILVEHMRNTWETMPHEFVVEFKNGKWVGYSVTLVYLCGK